MLDKIIALPPVEAIKTMAELNEAAGALQRAANHLYQETLRFEGAEGIGARYEIALDARSEAIYDKAIEDGKRIAVEICKAKAARQIRDDEPELWKSHRDISTDLKAARIWISQTKTAINARQSVLKGERD